MIVLNVSSFGELLSLDEQECVASISASVAPVTERNACGALPLVVIEEGSKGLI